MLFQADTFGPPSDDPKRLLEAWEAAHPAPAPPEDAPASDPDAEPLGPFLPPAWYM